jgi:hypothetical protein
VAWVTLVKSIEIGRKGDLINSELIKLSTSERS